jgi:hypothetical protein
MKIMKQLYQARANWLFTLFSVCLLLPNAVQVFGQNTEQVGTQTVVTYTPTLAIKHSLFQTA